MKAFILSIIAACCSIFLNAQPDISISGGLKLINSEPVTTTLWYVDESPSRDNIYTTVQPIGNQALNLSLRWQDDTPEIPLRLFMELQGYVGDINGLAFNGGFLYSGSKQGKVRIQPELSVVLGYCSKGIGEMQNNDVYIQVNETRFKDYDNVSVALRNAYLGVKPGLSIVFNTGPSSEFGIGINYQVSIKASFVSFSGIGQDGNSVSDYEFLSEDNVGFFVDNVKTDINPYNPDGLEFKVFYSF